MTSCARLASIIAAGFMLGAPAMAAEFRDLGALPDATVSVQGMSGVAVTDLTTAGGALARVLNLDPGSDLVLRREQALALGLGTSFRFTQTFAGIPIWKSEVAIKQSPDGSIAGVNGQAVFGISEPVETADPALSPDDALARARDLHGRGFVSIAPVRYENQEASLVYFVASDATLKLAYYTTFFLPEPPDGGAPTRPVYILDADTGATLHFYENLQHVLEGAGPAGNIKTGPYAYGTGPFPKFEVVEQGADCLMDGPDVLTENLDHASWGNGAPFSYACFDNTVEEINGAFSPLNDAHSFGQVAFDMYSDWYGTSPLLQKLHLRVHFSNGYENAFWDGQTMTFGDGKNLFHPLVSLDVVNHEVSHGFTEQNSDLIYEHQSGAINEAFSDMAGEAAEFYFVGKYGKPFARPMPDFQTGADIFKAAGAALRYMCEPTKDGASIDHVDKYDDTYDVHHASGIYNKVFCLLAQSPGWDTRKAFDIFVAANQGYWGPGETFVTGARAVLQATRDLNYPEADVIAAFDAVGIKL